MTTDATSFGQAADSYDQARPTYPRDAVDLVLTDHPRQVVDVGAGTGKLTSALTAPDREVTAVEPDEAMLARLRQQVPGVTALTGTAESIPLPDASADLVTFGQAWHWVDVPAASVEVGRVLRPGGVLGLLWNIRDTSTPWVAELGEVMGSSNAERLIEGEDAVRVAGPFGPLTEQVVAWSMVFDAESLVALAASRSYVITAEPADRQRILAGVRDLAGRVAAPDGTITMPYRTHVFSAVRH
ncbi:MAG TPA: methyltransferase domain-containing protein [Candidatus Ruania gallistercoris]|uniref:Methyltransferase domain-containing protein n=1 Tax=Candidatus Ruania gallistercoris TaxID=2838746 RepID=A0A9D2EHP2_9MICO|nr:methyltransferase domain-containing protein [Candidatus Ruania gallistercoris]